MAVKSGLKISGRGGGREVNKERKAKKTEG